MKTYVLGGGGHAKVVVATLQAAGHPVAGIMDDDARKKGRSILGVPILGPTEPELLREAFAVVAIGDNRMRRRVVEELPDTVRWRTVVHPTAVVHPSAVLGEGTVVFAGAVVQPETRIGRHAIVNTAATVDHDGRIGDFVHLAPGTRLAGDVTLEEGAFLGIGACVIPGRTVGAWTTVGAGAVVVHDLPPNTTAIGIPARPT